MTIQMALLLLLAVVVLSSSIQETTGQVEGSGWTERTFTNSLQIHAPDDAHAKNVANNPTSYTCPGNGCTYTKTGTLETFGITNTSFHRLEIRLNNDYATGWMQFQAKLKFGPPLDNLALFQILSYTGPIGQLRGKSANGGSLRYFSGPDTATVATGVYNRWLTVNVVHQQDVGVNLYLDGTRVGSFPETSPGVPNYFKYGLYMALTTPSAEAQWRNVRFFTKP